MAKVLRLCHYGPEDGGPPDGTTIGGDGEPIPPGDPDPYPSGG